MLNLKVGASVQDSIEQEPPIAAAGGVVYRWSAAGQLEILLIKKQDGFWTLPKGRIEPGEDERAAVLREVAEETSVTGEVGAMVRQVLLYHPESRPPAPQDRQLLSCARCIGPPAPAGARAHFAGALVRDRRGAAPDSPPPDSQCCAGGAGNAQRRHRPRDQRQRPDRGTVFGIDSRIRCVFAIWAASLDPRR